MSDSFSTPWTAACQASLSITISQSFLKLMSIESVIPSNHLILCCPLLLLPSIFPSIRFFSNESLFSSGGQSIGVSVSASLLLINIQDLFPLGLSGLVSFSSWDSQESSPNHSSKTSILQCSAFFMAHLSQPYMTTGKTIAFYMDNFRLSNISAFEYCLVFS